jgi:hypothetical protein
MSEQQFFCQFAVITLNLISESEREGIIDLFKFIEHSFAAYSPKESSVRVLIIIPRGLQQLSFGSCQLPDVKNAGAGRTCALTLALC